MSLFSSGGDDLSPGAPQRPLSKRMVFVVVLVLISGAVWFLRLGGLRSSDEPTVEVPRPPAPPRPLKEPTLVYTPKDLIEKVWPETTPVEASAPPPQTQEILDTLKQVLQGQQVQQAQMQMLIDAIRDKPPPAPAVQTPLGPPPETEQQRRARMREAAREEEERKNKLKQWKPLSGGPEEKKDEPGTVHRLKTPWSLAPNTLVEFVTEALVSNQSPGPFRAFVSVPVKDSATNTIIVIPQGAVLGLDSGGKTIFGDERMPIKVVSLAYKDRHVQLSKAGVGDRLGTSGFADEIDRHWGRLMASVLITGVLRGGSSMLMGYGDTAADRVGGAVAQESVNSGTRSVQQFIKTDPTLKTRPAYQGTLMLAEALELSEPLVEEMP